MIGLPSLALSGTPLTLAAALFVFGAALGTLDVAMNVHGAEIENREQRSLMSQFHAQFSIGGLFGVALMTLLLSLHVPMIPAALICAAVALSAMSLTCTRLLSVSRKEPVSFALPRGIVLLLAILAAIVFMVEGAVLDWGALLIVERKLIPLSSAGLGYILFSLAMVVARLTGDRIIAALGPFRVLVFGGLLTMVGIATVLIAASPPFALSGFIWIGLGAANLAPILFSAAGRQTIMPAGLAVASVTTIGYAGIFLGPVLIGFAADATSLPLAFWLPALFVAIVPLSARYVVRT